MAPFRVNKLSKTVVTASRLMRNHRLPQPNTDLLLPPVDASVFFCYRKPLDRSFRSVVNVLRNALSQTLGPHNALSGEMVKNVAGDPELLCSSRGMDFVEAFAGVNLRDLNFYNPDESIQGKLVPALEDGVLGAAQVTRLSCGGVVVGCTFDHRVIDGYSANMFWRSWAEMARSMPTSNLPSFHSSLTPPLGSGSSNPSMSNMNHVPISKLSPQQNPDDSTLPPPRISRIYSVSSEQINRLELFANYGHHSYLKPKRTKFEALSAYLWKLIATGIGGGDSYCRLGIAVDKRADITNENVLMSIPFGEKKTEKLQKMPLNSIADEIHDFVYAAETKEHYLTRTLSAEASRELSAMVVMPGNGFPVGKMDFGWGLPVFGSYHFQRPAQLGFVMPVASPSGNGDMIVYMHLPSHHIEVIEKVGGHVFKPFSLNL